MSQKQISENIKTAILMKLVLLIGFLLTSLIGFAQSNNSKPYLTTKYSGVYSFGKNIEKETVGHVTVYSETDTTILFYIDICRGGPSYNLGQLYGRLEIEDGIGFYFLKENYNKKGCKLRFKFDNKILSINTLDECSECGFGGNVIADNRYVRKALTTPKYFTNGEGKKVFFNLTSPEH